jgi:hypothetical protein
MGLRQLAGDVMYMTQATWRRHVRTTAVTVGVVVATVVFSYGISGAVTSYHGSDYSQDYNSYDNLRACDREADSNIVKGGWSHQYSGGQDGSITDGDGANGVCASAGTLSSDPIRRHQTCEKNFLAWDCDTWQATGA